MTFRDEALAANEAYAAGFLSGGLEAAPTRRVAVLACMDARVRPADALGIALGEANVLRNAGGRVTDDVVRSLLVSTAVLGVREAVVLHHTGCGLLGATNASLRARVSERTGEQVDDVDFLPFDDADRALLDDVEALAGDARLALERVSGFRLDVDTGRVRAIAS